MIDNYYEFPDRWRVEGTVEEVARIVYEGPDYNSWWPGVYLESKELVPGGEHGVGREVEFYERSLLPLKIRWRARVLDAHWPGSMTIEASGAFTGKGEWTLEQDGPRVNIALDWRVHTHSPIEKYGALIIRPIARLNHNWAMTRGEESLRLELLRRRARTPYERAAVPSAPGPAVSASALAAITAAGLAALGGGLAIWRLWSRRTGS